MKMLGLAKEVDVENLKSSLIELSGLISEVANQLAQLETRMESLEETIDGLFERYEESTRTMHD